jgi:hypothetical protein
MIAEKGASGFEFGLFLFVLKENFNGIILKICENTGLWRKINFLKNSLFIDGLFFLLLAVTFWSFFLK